MTENRARDVKRFYQLLGDLEVVLDGARKLSACSGRMNWPRSGVYFFREPGEIQTDSGNGSRIVRIGTHALKTGSKSTIWKRLSQHKGTGYVSRSNSWMAPMDARSGQTGSTTKLTMFSICRTV